MLCKINGAITKRYIKLKNDDCIMACFCGCETYEKSSNGYKIACVKCGHGPQNHEDEFRAAARTNEQQSQKRDVDFG
jgi:carbon monoxide dehydrogenase subunit G